MGRRLRRNYSFVFVIQAVSYVTPIRSLDQLWEHASIGALPGEVVLAIGFFSSTPGAEEFEAYVEPVKIASRYKGFEPLRIRTIPDRPKNCQVNFRI